MRALAAALLIASAVPGAAEPVEVPTRTIERFGRAAERDGARLAFEGGLVLRGPRSFGGISGVLVRRERFLAVTDVGWWLSGRLVEAEGRLAGLADVAAWPRLDLTGRAVAAKLQADAEGLAATADGIVVVVEQAVQLLRYPADGLAVEPDAPPRRIEIDHGLRIAGRRNGVEALATLSDGDLLAFAEGHERSGDTLAAFRLSGGAFAVARRGPWSITGADALPGGDVVIVERRYGGGIDIGMRVRRLGADAVRSSGGVVDGPVLLEADFGDEIDNMEGIAADVRDGRIALTLVSDDNQSWLQRTLILRFRVTDPLPRPKPERVAG